MKTTLRTLLGCWMLLVALSAGLLVAQDEAAPPDESAAAPTAAPTFEPLPTMEPRPASFLMATDDRARLIYFFTAIAQGGVGLAKIQGVPEITAVTATWLNRLIHFYPVPGDGFYGLLGVHIEEEPGDWPLVVSVTYADGSRSTLEAPVRVVDGGYRTENVTVPEALGPLLDPSIERGELARLESLTSVSTPQRYWDSDGFRLPILSSFTQPFGAYRIFNGVLNTRHTGCDLRAPVGQSIAAAADGMVAHVDELPIRGHYVLLDHGYGVYSGYAHLSEALVEPGETVERGQNIGLSGNSGRTNAPHLHWEIAIDGFFINCEQFVRMWQP
jgi:murein DD-endopeptidase MepM/ murein hydrolase activator NlpD